MPHDVTTPEFLNAIFNDLADGEAVCVARKGDRGFYQIQPSGKAFRVWLEDELDESWYFCISTVAVETPRQHKLQRRKQDCIAAFCIVLDDIGTKVEEPPVEPTWKIETSPGNYQWGYLLEPTEELDKVAALINGLAAAEMTDPGAKGVNRVVRLPGSANFKGERVFHARVTDWHPDRFWSLEELTEAFNVEPVATGETVRPAHEGGAQAAAEGVQDELLDWMAEQGMVVEDTKDEFVWIVCPWANEHTDGDNRARYSPLGRGNPFWQPRRGFRCFHAHCEGRNFGDLRDWVIDNHGPECQGHDPIPFLQQRYGVLVEGRKFIDFEFKRGGEDGWLIEYDEFAVRHPGQVRVIGRDRPVAIRTAFVEHPQTPQYDGLVYAPGRDDTFVTPGGRRCVNQFRQIPHEETDELPEAFLRHLEFILPAEDERACFLNWLAHKLQHPDQRSFAYVMVAEDAYGTGRSWIRDVLGDVFGVEEIRQASLSDILGVGKASHYNDWGTDCQLVVVEEAKDTVSKEEFYHAYETAKQYIDTRVTTHRINPKYGKIRQGAMHCNVLIFTNHGDAIVLPEGDRRFYIATNPNMRQDEDYYAGLQGARAEGEGRKLFWFLKRRSLEGYSHVYPADTEAKLSMIERTGSPTEEIMAWALENHESDLITRTGLLPVLRRGRDVCGYSEAAVGDASLEHLMKRLWRKAGSLDPEDRKNGARISWQNNMHEVRALRNRGHWLGVWRARNSDEMRAEMEKFAQGVVTPFKR